MIELNADAASTREAQQLVGSLMRHHAELLSRNDAEARAAVVVKMVALIALAFGIPPTENDGFDIDEIIEKLRGALAVIAAKERN